MTAVTTNGLGLDDLLSREWMTPNQLGGYACSTVPSFNTRKYHGLLVAAMSPPVRRMVLLSRVEDTLVQGDDEWPLASTEYPGTIFPGGYQHLRAFASEPFPRWAYQADGWTLQKELRLLRGSNTVCLSYTLLTGQGPAELQLRPLLAMRGIHELMYQWNGGLHAEKRAGAKNVYRIKPSSRTPELFFAHDGVEFDGKGYWYLNTIYRRERERGYAGLEDLWMPGVIRYALKPGQSFHFVCSTDPITDIDRVLAEADAQVPHASGGVVSTTAGGETDAALEALAHSADQFVLKVPPVSATANASPASATTAAAKDPVAVISAYPWSPPSARDALIAFTGLLLVTRRFDEARAYLVALAAKLHDGLIPTEFPEDGSTPVCDGADTSLWFVNAVYQYVRYSGDHRALHDAGLFDACAKIVEAYRAGTAGLGIRCDANGLIGSRVPGIGTSWMDAKVGDWVITPRQGKPVELNALWYNALRILAPWCEQLDQPRRADELNTLADQVKASFNASFWHEQDGCCSDVLMEHGPDGSIRPNQLLAISLPFAVLDAERHAAVLDVVRDRLLTPMGVRTLVPGDPAYRDRYEGDVVSRDRAYHQGSAYPWLLGAYVTALVRARGPRVNQARAEALSALRGCLDYLAGPGLGQLCELFNGSEPHLPGGALASARSVGEILRCYVEDVLGRSPQIAAPAVESPAGIPPRVKT